MIKIEKPEKEKDLIEEDKENLEENEFLENRLAGYVMDTWDKARLAKQEYTERLLNCDRARRGEYSPDKALEIKNTGGSDIYMMITDVKCRGAASWIKDVMQSYQDRPWQLDISEVPDIPPEVKKSIESQVMMELEEFLAMGQEMHPETFRTRMEEVHDQTLLRIREEAKDTARRMENVIEDEMKAGKFHDAFGDFIDDYVTYPVAVLKGPTVRKVKKLKWGKNFKAVIATDLVREVDRVSPYDIFPSPNSMGVDDGYIIERHKLNRQQLQDMIGISGYNEDNILAAIDQYGMSGYQFYEYGDNEKKDLDGNYYNQTYNDPSIEALEFWGPVSGEMLKEGGLKDKSIKDDRQYEANIWMVGRYVIKVIINPDPLGKRPYNIANWEEIPGNFWGVALPEIMTDVQTMCNASARSLANNMGIASGPQVEAVIDRLADGEDLTNMYPWKIWQTTSDKTGGGQPGIRFYQPDMQAGQLMGIYNQFAKQADEVTGIPNYVYGSSSVGGAGRTASGLSMLMDNASKSIKQAIIKTDKVVAGIVERYYIHNMLYNPDKYIKGDFKVVPKGAMGLIAKEQTQMRRNEFLAATGNPVDLQIVGQEGRAYLLREVAKGLRMDTDKIVKSPEVLKYDKDKIEQAMMAQMQQQQPQPQQQTLDGAGDPAGGVDVNTQQGV